MRSLDHPDMQAVLWMLQSGLYPLTREHWYSELSEYYSYIRSDALTVFTREERDLLIAHLRVTGHALA